MEHDVGRDRFTGIAGILITVIVVYPVQAIKMLFFDAEREELVLNRRTLSDPGMLGMAMAAFVLLIMGLPLLIVASAVLLFLYGIVPFAWIAWAADPMVFQFVFYIFAHNLMEAMAIMIVAAVYATLPFYLADGTRKLYSETLAKLALWILLLTSVTSFFHHFYTMFPALPSALSYHGNIMSWGTGVGAAITIFTVAMTIWKHGLRPEAGGDGCPHGASCSTSCDGVSAIITSNVAWSFSFTARCGRPHTMAVLTAVAMMWMGVMLHHFSDHRAGAGPGPRQLFVTLFTIGALGVNYSFLAAGAAGMPRRFAAWDQEGWMTYGYLILAFGLCLALSLVVFMIGLSKSRDIDTPAAVPAE